MEGEESLERYLEQCESQDGQGSTTPDMYTPMTPYNDLSMHSLSDMNFSQIDQSKDLSTDFSSVDLSFLPDELSQDNSQLAPHVDYSDEMHLGGHYKSQTLGQDSGICVDEADNSQSYAAGENTEEAQQFQDTPAFCATPMTPMTPMTPVTESSGIIPQLQNIVSTVNLACRLDLKNIALHARNAEYNPKNCL